MLSALQLTNFLIVKTLELDFKSGMTAFTGETGAGKSIMIDALMLAMGGRSDASVVRSGEDKCIINAVFYIQPNTEPQQWLEQQDIDIEESHVQLQRVIYAEGRSKSYLNGQLLPLQKIREFCQTLVHIHGQHQHQTLLQHATHRQQLDQYAQHPSQLNAMKQAYQNWLMNKREWDALTSEKKDAEKEQWLQFQLEELEGLHVQDGEIEALDAEHRLLHHAKDYLEHCHTIHELLASEEQSAIGSGLHQALHHIHELPQDNLHVQTASELLGNALIQCEEAQLELQRFHDIVQLDPERLQEVEHRLSALHQLARKHQVGPSELTGHIEALKIQLQSLQQKEQRLQALLEVMQEQEKSCLSAAHALTKARKKAAHALEDKITAIIQKLGMPKGFVKIEISSLDTFHAHGMDRVEYKVCTNPGMPADSLSKIASGGELSRISLAIQMITAQQGATPTLLFDEVDVGIGGATAALVGKLLRQLGERLQVFCVTHQPQVAAAAHHQLRVEKTSKNEQTFSRVVELNQQTRTDEIARMLGGLTITEQTRTAAREMLAAVEA